MVEAVELSGFARKHTEKKEDAVCLADLLEVSDGLGRPNLDHYITQKAGVINRPILVSNAVEAIPHHDSTIDSFSATLSDTPCHQFFEIKSRSFIRV